MTRGKLWNSFTCRVVCSHAHREPTCRPIKVLRLFVSVFFQVFYIAALGVFLVAIDCHWLGSDDSSAEFKKHYIQSFQDVKCTSMPHLAHLFVSIILIIVFIIVSLTITAADFELNPLSRRWLAAASSTVEVRLGDQQHAAGGEGAAAVCATQFVPHVAQLTPQMQAAVRCMQALIRMVSGNWGCVPQARHVACVCVPRA